MTLTVSKAAKAPKRPLGRMKKPKTTKVSILRSYGLSGTERMRYKNPLEKGIYWFFFSKRVRERDVSQFGTCISCDRPITVDTSDCGHFIPASECGRDLLFDPRNNNAECSRCNAWDELHLFGYARGLDRRYGEGTADSLLKRHRELKFLPPLEKAAATKDFTRLQYVAKIIRLASHGL